MLLLENKREGPCTDLTFQSSIRKADCKMLQRDLRVTERKKLPMEISANKNQAIYTWGNDP